MAAPGPSPYADGSPLLDRSPLVVSDPGLAVADPGLAVADPGLAVADPGLAVADPGLAVHLDDAPAPPAHPEPPEHDVAVVEQRSFARAVCATCGWRGPGRRARAFAVADIEEHRLLGSAAVTIDLRDRG